MTRTATSITWPLPRTTPAPADHHRRRRHGARDDDHGREGAGLGDPVAADRRRRGRSAQRNILIARKDGRRGRGFFVPWKPHHRAIGPVSVGPPAGITLRPSWGSWQAWGRIVQFPVDRRHELPITFVAGIAADGAAVGERPEAEEALSRCDRRGGGGTACSGQGAAPLQRGHHRSARSGTCSPSVRVLMAAGEILTLLGSATPFAPGSCCGQRRWPSIERRPDQTRSQ